MREEGIGLDQVLVLDSAVPLPLSCRFGRAAGRGIRAH